MAIEPLEKILIVLAGIFSLAGIITAYVLNWSFATQIWNATAGLLWILAFYQGRKIMTMEIKIRQMEDRSEKEARNWRITGH